MFSSISSLHRRFKNRDAKLLRFYFLIAKNNSLLAKIVTYCTNPLGFQALMMLLLGNALFLGNVSHIASPD